MYQCKEKRFINDSIWCRLKYLNAYSATLAEHLMLDYDFQQHPLSHFQGHWQIRLHPQLVLQQSKYSCPSHESWTVERVYKEKEKEERKQRQSGFVKNSIYIHTNLPLQTTSTNRYTGRVEIKYRLHEIHRDQKYFFSCPHRSSCTEHHSGPKRIWNSQFVLNSETFRLVKFISLQGE